MTDPSTLWTTAAEAMRAAIITELQFWEKHHHARAAKLEGETRVGALCTTAGYYAAWVHAKEIPVPEMPK